MKKKSSTIISGSFLREVNSKGEQNSVGNNKNIYQRQTEDRKNEVSF